MPWVVFLRGVNVGGHNRFQPKLLAGELSHLGMVNIGAAGTFVVREKISEERVRAEILSRLPFVPDVMICPAYAILEGARGNPFRTEAISSEVRAFVTVLAKAPAKVLRLPLYAPVRVNWEVKIVQVKGTCVFSLWRRRGTNPLYPNEVIEKHFAVAATTRSWNTLEKIVRILTDPPS